MEVAADVPADVTFFCSKVFFCFGDGILDVSNSADDGVSCIH